MNMNESMALCKSVSQLVVLDCFAHLIRSLSAGRELRLEVFRRVTLDDLGGEFEKVFDLKITESVKDFELVYSQFLPSYPPASSAIVQSGTAERAFRAPSTARRRAPIRRALFRTQSTSPSRHSDRH